MILQYCLEGKITFKAQTCATTPHLLIKRATINSAPQRGAPQQQQQQHHLYSVEFSNTTNNCEIRDDSRIID